ncbi:exocyst complex component SEC15B-like [Nicotiana tabacum]|uniref:Exocyst complex component n=1 Tax=Nicotiana tabacum TaxID=4097 RepID=A0A1S3Z6Z3_TOBAC|nr:PREDICTED: exocyst complex component SEC15B-like isoform X1 [Nicotiana tabacum]XP_016460120.1 PREDICTED: exocyst complex component SEC15B-like isoform X2 [Nicotiana tabacum]XP_016460121.1 PREDICTED: exocyst complex component SEC15B-like isoform X3 [Nicotiana tabacum]XP_016460122.1 PREDICTED: exocyst complex component SEC15B-like isoform X4 [Nicotiana tabacum]XP_016460124.1 PREDICTED: exocyst complex component SEC15B-like isoform X5 [Nicotiana tabacum]
MNTSKMRRKVVPAAVDNGDSADKLDQLLLSASICNGEDVGPFVRKAFASGKPETLLHHLRHFTRSKESEIEDVCRAHYEDFITAVDDLRSLLSDVDSLKSSLSNSNSQLQSVSVPLLTTLDSFVEARNKCTNITLAIQSLRTCVQLVELCSRANRHLSENNFYMALKCVDSIEREFVNKTPSSTLKRMLEKQIPAIRSHIERKINKEFGDWLVEIRVVSRNLGQLAIGQASASRQREEELRIKQRQAEEQSRLSLRDCVYALEEEDDDGFDGISDDAKDGNGILGFDLTPLYRAYHINQTLGLEDRFKQYYFENRKLQLTSDFQVSSMTPFLESHQTFFAQIAGFFIVEDRVLRTGGGLVSKLEVENLWDTAMSKMCSVLEDQFSRMQTANHLLLIKDYVSLLGVTLRRYGYPVEALLDVLSKHRDKYHELLLSDCRKQITEVLAADKFEQMYMKKEYEYNMNVLSFQLQTSNIMPAFPYVAPFSCTVPDCCRIVRSFIEDSVSFMSYGGQLDFYDVVKKYLDRLLTEVLDGALLKLINTSIGGVTQAMQMAANMAVFERACDFFFRHAAQLSGIPLRMAERGRRLFPLTKARDAAEEMLSGLLKQKVDGFLLLIENVNWMVDDPPQGGNEYVHEVTIFLETLVSTAQQILPVQVLKRVLQDVLFHISEMIVGALLGESVKRFNVNAIMGLEADVKMLESFAESQATLLSEADASQLKAALAESRQLVNLLLSNHPENFLNPVIRERSYNALDYRKVVTISEKLRDQSDRLFGSFGTRGSKTNTKKKSLDALIKRLKDVN